MAILAFFKKRINQSDIDEIEALVRDLGLLPECFITPTVLRCWQAEISSIDSNDSIDSVLHQERHDFLSSWHKKYKKYARKKSSNDLFFVDTELF